MSWTDPANVPPPPPTGADILRTAPKWVRVMMLVLFGAWVVMLGAMVASQSANLLGWVIEVPVLGLLTLPLARRIARSDRDPEMVWFVMAAFSAKMLGALVRYYFTYIAYVSAGDAEEYNAFGKYLAPFYRRLDFSPDVGQVPGTGFMKAVAGVLYALTGGSKIGAFAVFSWFGFLGLLLCWRAFKRAVPSGDSRRYAMLVLFLPSLLYWTSALGKDAWSVMGLGICSYGVARVMTRKPVSGLVLTLLGLAVVVSIRPPVGLVIFAGFLLAAVLYKPHKESPLNPIIRVVVFGILFLMLTVLISQTQSFLGVDNLDQETVNSQLNRAEGRTIDAGSTFQAVHVNTPLDFPYAAVTVLFRPFPWESHNGQSLATAIESGFLVYLGIRGWRRLLNIPRTARREAYVAYCIGIVITFIYAYSSFSNFGILARERCQVMPFFLVLLCMAPYPKKTRPATAEETDVASLAPQPVDPYAGFDGPDPSTHEPSRSEHG